MYAVAKLADVSIATVSRVVNTDSRVKEKTRQKVLSAMLRLGYQPNSIAQSLATRTSNSVGVLVSELHGAFYGAMLPRLCALGQQRTIFARLGERDVGYILGAVMAGEYRGLQFSYDADLAQFGIGGLLQYQQVLELCGEDIARYDLGTEMDYKRRWAEDIMETEMLVVVR